MGWFYGFKLHLIVNHQGGIVAAKITPANVHDTKPVKDMVVESLDKFYLTRVYWKSVSWRPTIRGVTIVNNVRTKLKEKALSLWG